MSTAFFDSAVKVSTVGAYADKISASGRTNSDVQILGVKQLAKAAIYTDLRLPAGAVISFCFRRANQFEREAAAEQHLWFTDD